MQQINGPRLPCNRKREPPYITFASVDNKKIVVIFGLGFFCCRLIDQGSPFGSAICTMYLKCHRGLYKDWLHWIKKGFSPTSWHPLTYFPRMIMSACYMCGSSSMTEAGEWALRKNVLSEHSDTITINLTPPLHFVTRASVKSPSKCPGLSLEAIPKVLYIYIDTATGSQFHCLHRTTYIRVGKKQEKHNKIEGKKIHQADRFTSRISLIRTRQSYVYSNGQKRPVIRTC